MRMEVCDDMAIDLQLASVRKRQYAGDMVEHPNCYFVGVTHQQNVGVLQKRLCPEIGSIDNGNGLTFNPMNDCDMLCWQMQMSTDNKIPAQQFASRPESRMDYMPFESHERTNVVQPCPRCIAGESGHINHIMGI